MQGLQVLSTNRHTDERGFFAETYCRKKFVEYGINIEFVQDNHSISETAGTLRGLHFQAPPFAQAKLVRCGRGAIFDVALDIRRGSPTYGQWQGIELTEENGLQFFIPIGFAHGFVSLVPSSEIIYKCSEYYAPEKEGSIVWNDPSLAIEWPLDGKPMLSSKDATAPQFESFESPFIYGVNS